MCGVHPYSSGGTEYYVDVVFHFKGPIHVAPLVEWTAFSVQMLLL